MRTTFILLFSCAMTMTLASCACAKSRCTGGRETIATVSAPAAVGPYSQAVRSGNVIYASGQIAIDPTTGKLVDGDIKAQTHRVMKNIGAVLEAAGCGYDDVVKATCFLRDIDDFAAFNEVYAVYMTTRPARSCVSSPALPKGALVEVEVIAVRPDK